MRTSSNSVLQLNETTMQGLAILAVLSFAFGQILARDSRLSNDCLHGNRSAEECCALVPDAWYAHLRNPANCRTFFHCAHGKPVLKNCPANLHWSIVEDRCEWPKLAGCVGGSSTTPKPYPKPTTVSPSTAIPTVRPSTPAPTTSSPSESTPMGCRIGAISAVECCRNNPSHINLHLPHEFDCGLFYQCEHGKPTLKKCPAPLHFNPRLEVCDWPSRAGCKGTSEIPPVSSTPRPTTTKPTIHPSTFIPTTTKPSTQESTTFEPHTPLPLPSASCYTGEISAAKCCRNNPWWNNLHLPHETDCRLFYQCENGKPTLKKCPEPLYFNRWLQVCDWPNNARCKGSTETHPASSTPRPATTKPTVHPTTQAPSTAKPSTAAPITTALPSSDCSPKIPSNECLTGEEHPTKCCQGIENWQHIHLANPDNCGSYWDCIDSKPVQRDCPKALNWNVETDRCEWPHESKCSAGTTSKPAVDPTTNAPSSGISEDCLYGRISAEKCCKIVPSSIDVLLQNNDNCNTYYQCVHGKPVVRPCPVDLKWSAKANRCEWPRLATCKH